MTREELIATVSKITELRAQIAELAAKQKELKRLEALLDSVTGVVSEPSATRQRQGLSIEERIGRLLEEGAERDWSAEEIAQQIDAKIQTVRASLSKLRHAGRIADTRRGHVQAKVPSGDEPKEGDLGLTSKAA